MTTICKVCNLDKGSNELEILVRQLKRDLEKHIQDDEAVTLLQNGKIAELCVYLKTNLSNSIRELLDTMDASGELDKLISEAVSNELGSINAIIDEYFTDGSKEDLQSMEISNRIQTNVKRQHETTYLVTRVNKLIAQLQFSNGGETGAFENNQSVIEYMTGANKILAINAGLKGVTIRKGKTFISKTGSSHEPWYTLGITECGILKCFDRSVEAAAIIAAGCTDATGIWCPIIQDGVNFEALAIIDKNDPNYDYILKQAHPRQILGVDKNGDYVIITCDGRIPGEKGFTFLEMQEVARQEGCVDAYNLDGGSSTQIVQGKTLLNRLISRTRNVGTIITFE